MKILTKWRNFKNIRIKQKEQQMMNQMTEINGPKKEESMEQIKNKRLDGIQKSIKKNKEDKRDDGSDFQEIQNSISMEADQEAEVTERVNRDKKKKKSRKDVYRE